MNKMEDLTTYLASGDKLIKTEEGFFVHYIGHENPIKIIEERGIELLFGTCEGLRLALESFIENR